MIVHSIITNQLNQQSYPITSSSAIKRILNQQQQQQETNEINNMI